MKKSALKHVADLYSARHEPENIGPLAVLYWRTLLLATFALVIAIICFGIGEFTAVMQQLNPPTENAAAPQPNVLNLTQLNLTITNFAARSAFFDSLKVGTTTESDPSQ